jgi:hypothetical protein
MKSMNCCVCIWDRSLSRPFSKLSKTYAKKLHFCNKQVTNLFLLVFTDRMWIALYSVIDHFVGKLGYKPGKKFSTHPSFRQDPYASPTSSRSHDAKTPFLYFKPLQLTDRAIVIHRMDAGCSHDKARPGRHGGAPRRGGLRRPGRMI